MRFVALFLFVVISTCGSIAQANEGYGLLVRDLDGALPKALWRKQYRSEITYMLDKMPADSSLRSVQVIKRNMLLSNYDTRLIINDVDIKPGMDLLTLRLRKLMEMGLWEDAFKLYTKTTEDPGNNDSLAQTGVLLILLQKGLSTACLEEKVIAPRFPSSLFWQQIDKACNVELGTIKKSDVAFPNSTTLQSTYLDKNFKIEANDIDALERLTSLELAMIALKGRINYNGLSLKEKTPPHLIKTFLEDSKFPKNKRKQLERIARQKALLPALALSDSLEKQSNNAKTLNQTALKKLISAKLRAGKSLTKHEIERLKTLSTEYPENIFFLKILQKTRLSDESINIPEQDVQAESPAFSPKQQEKVNFLKSLLDKRVEFSNNLATVYEKHISLTPEGGYVMPTGTQTTWLEKTKQHQLSGLSLLIILSNIEKAYADNTETGSTMGTIDVLESLSTVGLIDQAHQIAAERLADLMATN